MSAQGSPLLFCKRHDDTRGFLTKLSHFILIIISFNFDMYVCWFLEQMPGGVELPKVDENYGA